MQNALARTRPPLQHRFTQDRFTQDAVQLIVVERGAPCPLRHTADGSVADTVLIAQLPDEPMAALTQRVAARMEAIRAGGQTIAGVYLFSSRKTTSDLLRSRLLLTRTVLRALPDRAELALSGALLETEEGQKDVWAIVDMLLPQLGKNNRVQVKFPEPRLSAATRESEHRAATPRLATTSRPQVRAA